jgi:hypothetical protein
VPKKKENLPIAPTTFELFPVFCLVFSAVGWWWSVSHYSALWDGGGRCISKTAKKELISVEKNE